MTIKAVMFDLDGTLLDTAPDFIYILNLLRAEEQLPPLDDQSIRNTVSEGARALVTLGFDCKEGEPGFEELRQRLLDLYVDNLAAQSVPFQGIAELLDSLLQRGIAWGIATNKPQRYTAPLLTAQALNPGCVICPDDVTHPKPHPESLFLAADLLACEREQIIYIGDHHRDIECGRQADCITIAAAYGYIPATEDIDSWRADHRVEHAAEIWPIVEAYLAS